MTPKIFRSIILASISAGVFTTVFAQQPPPSPPASVDRVAPAVPAISGASRRSRQTSELSISAAQNVNIKFCVSEGVLNINGWERPEVRVFIKSGREFGFRVLEKDNASEMANWLWILPVEKSKSTEPAAECISGDLIEMDVPLGASLNISGRTVDIKIDTVKRAGVKNIEGNILLRNINGGITASTYQGNVTAENSAGAIALESASGNISAFKVNPGQIGDVFKAKTNSGSISIQEVSHRQIEASSITGSVFFDGAFLAGGIYNLKTSNGALKMLIPSDSSCRIVSNYGFGSFDSNLPLKFIYKNDTAKIKNLSALLGAGESCSLNLTTNSGSILLRRKK